MTSELGAVGAGLMGAVAFGAGDIAGGAASRQINGLSAVALAQIVAAATALIVLASAAGSVPEGASLVYAMMAGAFHVLAVFYIYQGIARGRVCVIAPVSGVIGIALPVIVDLAFIKMASGLQIAGIVLAALSVVLMANSAQDQETNEPLRFSLKCAVLSGLGFGCADLCLGLMTAETAEGGLAVARTTGAVLALTVLMARGGITATLGAGAALLASAAPRLPGATAGTVPVLDARLRLGILLCIAAGALDCIGQLGYVLSATQGQMSVAAALIATYPAVSAALAIYVFGERISARQAIGLGVSLTSILLLSQ